VPLLLVVATFIARDVATAFAMASTAIGTTAYVTTTTAATIPAMATAASTLAVQQTFLGRL
jgi:hypothetical protein